MVEHAIDGMYNNMINELSWSGYYHCTGKDRACITVCWKVYSLKNGTELFYSDSADLALKSGVV